MPYSILNPKNVRTVRVEPSGSLLLVVCSLLIICCFLLFFSPVVSAAKLPSLEQRYNQSKFYFNQLETSPTLSSDRENWLKGANDFQELYLSQPTSELAPACLYMLARMHHGMYERFQRKDDLQGSINYYKDTARLFSEHRLADDSYYSIGLIYLNDLDNPTKAADFLSKVVNSYPNGDMHPLAADVLKQLSKDHDIPLPEVMIGNSQLSKLSYVLPVKY